MTPPGKRKEPVLGLSPHFRHLRWSDIVGVEDVRRNGPEKAGSDFYQRNTRAMNAPKTTLLHRLSPVVLLLLLGCVVWLLVDEWRKVRMHRVSDEPGPTVAARPTSNNDVPAILGENRAQANKPPSSPK